MGMMYTDVYRLTTVLQTINSSKDTYQGARRAEHEGEGEGDGEEDVLIGDVGVAPAVVKHEQGRGHRYSPHETGCDTQRVQRSHLQADALGVEEQEAEPVRGEHQGDAEGDE